MHPTTKKQIKILLILLVIIAMGLFTLIALTNDEEEVPAVEEVVVVPEEVVVATSSRDIIGMSVEGRAIEVYTYGVGDTHLLFVGGIHGGYEWNSVVLAYELIDYLESSYDGIPKDVSVSVIPSANPDGVYAVIEKEGRFTVEDVPEDEGPTGTGRFNANDVDLNRNFDCKWQSESTWRGEAVAAGSEAFSEPEAQAIRDLVEKTNPKAVVFFHSQSDAVYASECEEGVLPETLEIMNVYGQAADYKTVESFDAYEITGDAEGWLASIGIPALTVELSSHTVTEWEKNKAGVEALFEYYSTTP